MNLQSFVTIGAILLAPLPSLASHLAGDGYERLRSARAAALPPALSGAEVEHGFDVLSYDLFLHPNIESGTLNGIATIRVRGTMPRLEEIGLHLADLQADTLRVDGVQTSALHSQDSLRVILPEPLLAGDTTEVQIAYSGSPTAGLYFRQPGGRIYIYTYNAPYDARHWFPCWDLPGDKATARMTLRVPEALHVYGNGRLVGVTPGRGGERTWIWDESHAIATYLMSVEIGNYASLHDTVWIDDLAVPIHHEVFPEDSSAALEDFLNVGEMLRFFSDETDEPYPFDKYGYGEVPGLGGAMEDQTCVTIGSGLITGTRAYEDVVAHEAAHMWFGDLVTPDDFRSVWLNEGFATYWDALFSNHLYGSEAFRERLLEYRGRESYLWSSTPIWDPPLAQIYSSIEYEKAGLVLHMLRWVMGDAAFYEAIATHVREGRFAHASTASFQAQCEAAAQMDLGWFFGQWIYAAGKPLYEWSWHDAGSGNVELYFGQPAEPRFAMPLPLRAHGPWGSLDLRVDVPAETQVALDLVLPGPVDSLQFDPDLWILCAAEEQPWLALTEGIPRPDPLIQLGRPSPNPFNPRLLIPLEVSQGQPLRLTIHDLRGLLVATLVAEELPAGRHQVVWEGRSDQGRACASGVYFVRLEAATAREERAVLLLR